MNEEAELFTNLTCSFCQKEFKRLTSQITGKNNFCSNPCRYKFFKKYPVVKGGKDHPSWKGGKQLSKEGYILLWVGRDYKTADRNGIMLEHRYIMEQHLGRYLKKSEVIHHKNGNRQDNSIENLELLKNASEHSKIHYSEKHKRPIINSEWHFLWEKCISCGQTDSKHHAKGKCKRCYLREWRSAKGAGNGQGKASV